MDRLLVRGVPLRRILMLTFTEKAAGELKLRLRQERQPAWTGAADQGRVQRTRVVGHEQHRPLRGHVLAATGVEPEVQPHERHRQGLQEVVLAMAHRGRLNVLANLLKKKPREIFREFEDPPEGRRRSGGDGRAYDPGLPHAGTGRG